MVNYGETTKKLCKSCQDAQAVTWLLQCVSRKSLYFGHAQNDKSLVWI